MTNEQASKLKAELIELVVHHIKQDIEYGDVEAVEELLSFCPTKNLVGFLPEEEWDKFFELEQFNS